MSGPASLWGDASIWLDVGFWAVSLVLVASGASKVMDASRFVQSLSQLTGRRVPLTVGRVVGAGEVALGLAGLSVGGRLVAALVAVVYGAFAVVVAMAIRGRLPSCGCFGAASSRPRPAHLVVNIVSTVLAAWVSVRRVPPVADGLAGLDGGAVVVVVVMLVITGGVVFVDTR